MNRTEFFALAANLCGAEPDYPWSDHPNFAVLRHPGNRKWFALVMDLPRSKLGLEGEGYLDVVNLKCDPVLIGSLLSEAGVYPAYHMSKSHWISAALDDSLPEERLEFLLNLSYDLTAPKGRRPKPKA